MEHELWLTALLNRLLAGPVVSLLGLFGIHPESPAHPLPNYVAMEFLVVVILMALLAWLRSRFSHDRPGRVQQLFELLAEGLGSQSEEIIGHEARHFLPLLFTLAVFIFFCNVLGTIPTLETPTDQISVTLGCALVAFTYYNYWGIRHHGLLRYLKTFMGPVLYLAPLMSVIELISHFARLLSLSVRLYANMLAGHQITLVFFSLIPLALPSVFMGLHIFVGALQAFIFVLLTMVYLGGAVSEEH